ncbi:hypothetical protein G6F66_003737 [Rhizopus arrhizus]|nr:hypothetical protein G6F66_003737 [Rhizopus arrhizus]
MCRYIRLALAISVKLWSSGQLLKTDHDESWYRTHVYSAVWDNAFLHDTKFTSKRADCYSSITKEFNNIKNQWVDFILRNINDSSDYLSAEEKPTLKGVKADFSVYMMPKEETHTASFAISLAAILSLKRLVFINYTKLNTVLEIKHTHELQTMQFFEEDEFNLRSDSTEGYENQEDEYETNAIDPHLESDILSALDQIETDSEEDIVNFKDWEKFIMEHGRTRKNVL